MHATVQTGPARPGDDPRTSDHTRSTLMRIDRKILLGVAFATAASLLAAGCGNVMDTTSAPKPSVGTVVDDTVITAKVKSALVSDPAIKSFDLKVETLKGEVQLSGFVENQQQIDLAVSTTRSVEGVKEVENKIALRTDKASVGNKVDDGIITAKVKSALLADPNVKSLDIAVVTRKGEVQLSGFVDNQTQIDEATAIVNKIEGVTKIDNELSIKK
jgi:hyperosmotically inducible protein